MALYVIRILKYQRPAILIFAFAATSGKRILIKNAILEVESY